MIWLYSELAAALIFAASLPACAATVAATRNRALSDIPFSVGFLFVVAIVLVIASDKAMLMGRHRRASSSSSSACRSVGWFWPWFMPKPAGLHRD